MSKGIKDYAKEWLDTLVVAISVAMAFRAYFYEPFNIPTGSMQPTLYGNHYEACENPGIMQSTPLKWLNWAATGRDYKELVAPFSGQLVLTKRNDGRYNLILESMVSGQESISIPTDAVSKLNFGPNAVGKTVVLEPFTAEGKLNLTSDDQGNKYLGNVPIDNAIALIPDQNNRAVFCIFNKEGYLSTLQVPAGHKIFGGYDTTGDFVFVNRWKWNFRRPARGDVMVFRTTGIEKLDQGTHYIKRVTALPNEKIEIKDGNVYINGEILKYDLKPMVGKKGEATPKPNGGRMPNGKSAMENPVQLGANEYFTCGDNSDNSFDSRYWGSVPERNVTGNASCVFWPIINPRWGSIK